MAVCVECCRGVGICPNADGTGACNEPSFIDVSSFRINGVYTSGFRSQLPPSLRDVGDSHVDALRGSTNTSLPAPALSGSATTLYNGGVARQGDASWITAVTMDFSGIADLVAIFKKHPKVRDEIQNQLQQWTFAGANDANGQRLRDSVANGLKYCDDWILKEEKLAKTNRAGTSAEYEDQKLPLARIWVLITKFRVTSKNALAQKLSLTDGLFSKESGTQVTTFETMKSVHSSLELSLILRDFEQGVVLIGKNGGKSAWAPFVDLIFQMAESRGFQFAHVFVLRALKVIDEDPSMNVTVFMRERFNTVLMLFLEEQRAGDRENEPPAVGDPDGPAKELKGSVSRFGPITKQGAAGIEKLRSGKVAYCTPWNEGTSCTRGVLKGKHKGLCAYTHKCLKCAGDHRYSDKKDDGSWVCAKHD